jgi:hypothetical protein
VLVAVVQRCDERARVTADVELVDGGAVALASDVDRLGTAVLTEDAVVLQLGLASGGAAHVAGRERERLTAARLEGEVLLVVLGREGHPLT